VGTETGGVVRIGGGAGDYQLSFSAQIRAATTYDVVLTAMSVTGWKASFSTSTTPVLTRTLGPFGADGQQPIGVFLRANNGSAPANLALSITARGDPSQFGQVNQPVALLP